jgi:osmotically-inducible protein OsmY
MNASQAVDRVAGLVRSATRRADRAVRGAASFAGGKATAVRHRETAKAGMDDQTLKSKVETEIFRPADAPKSTVNVGVVDAVVELRGEVKNPGAKQELEDKTRSIPEVREVKNLLHLPKTPAPGRADSPGRQRTKSP